MVEIITIGNEILLGAVLDTNTNWLCKQIRGLGGKVRRVTIIPDEVEAIAQEVRLGIKRSDLIFTSGGLGPTEDDMTLKAIAKATNTKLAVNKEAYDMVSRRYGELFKEGQVKDFRMTPAREKMALLPEGSVPLYNSVGTAPGVLLKHKQSTVICLPGVPAELEGIFKSSLQPHLQRIFGRGKIYLERMLTLNLNDESILAPILKRVSKRWPGVYLKSRAKGFEKDLRIVIMLSASGTQEEVEQMVNTALGDLKSELTKKRIAF